MVFNVNHLPADYSREIESLIYANKRLLLYQTVLSCILPGNKLEGN